MGTSDVEILEESEGGGTLGDDRTLGAGRALGEHGALGERRALGECGARGDGRTLGDPTGGGTNRRVSSDMEVLAGLEVVAKAAISIIA